jgi:hypothetical protein
MTLLAPRVEEVYPVGAVIEANYPPSDNWLICQGQILSQSNYSVLYGMMDNPHPLIYSDWNFCTAYDTGGDYPWAERRVTWNGSTGSPVWISDGDYVGYSYSSNAITWTLNTSLPSTGYWYFAWNGTVFCGVKFGSNAGATSTDGSSWTARTLNLSANWTDIVWDGTNFVAIASNNVQTIKSSDGITWSNAGVLPETGFVYAASDGSGTIVTIDSSNDICYSIDGGTTWVKTEGPQGPWYSIEYCNGYFLVATARSYVGISSNGYDWEWVGYASDKNESFDESGSVAAQIQHWRYYDGIYFGLANNDPIGVYSFDLRTFHPWFCNPFYTELYDIVYNPVSGNLTCFGGYGGEMPYTQKVMDRYDDSTHFQLPNYFKSRYFERAKHRYIRVK